MEYYLNDSEIPVGIHDIIMLATGIKREEMLGLTPALIVLMKKGFEVRMR